MLDPELLEGIARSAHVATGYEDPPVDAFDLAECCGLIICWRRGPTHMLGRTVYVDPLSRLERQHGGVAHELAHALLREHREVDEERSARYLAGLDNRDDMFGASVLRGSRTMC